MVLGVKKRVDSDWFMKRTCVVRKVKEVVSRDRCEVEDPVEYEDEKSGIQEEHLET